MQRSFTYDRSIASHKLAKSVLAGGVSTNFRYGGDPVPLTYASGHGAHLVDLDGNRYVDYALGNGATILGHAPPSVLKAVADTLDQGQLFAAQHEAEIALAGELVEVIPCAELIRFASSGSESLHAVMRLARAATGKPKIVKFEGQYHGWFDGAFISVKPGLNMAGPYPEPLPVSETLGQVDSALADVIVLPWNNLELAADVLRRRRDEIAGVLTEGIMSNSAVIPPKPGFLEGLRDLCTEIGAVLIFDEVITGFRVGLTGAQGKFGVTPDIAVFAKAMAAGFPLSCFAGRRDLMELLETKSVMHGGTYNGNVVCIAAGRATLAELRKDNAAVYPRMEAHGKRLMAGIAEIAARVGIPMRVQGFGQVFHPAFIDPEIEITDYRTFAKADATRQRSFVQGMQHAGVRLTTRGTWFLSAAHETADIDASLEAAETVLRKLSKEAAGKS